MQWQYIQRIDQYCQQHTKAFMLAPFNTILYKYDSLTLNPFYNNNQEVNTHIYI